VSELDSIYGDVPRANPSADYLLEQVFDAAPPDETEPPMGESPAVRIVSLDVFADTDEEGDEALLGDAENAVIPEGGDVMFYGDGGAGKTTLAIDLACHLAAGDNWLGIAVSQPRRVLIVENEGPRPKFRGKLRRKRDAWTGSPMGDRVAVLEDPWGAFSFAHEPWREFLAEHVREHEVDVVVCGPVVSAGMEFAGTLQEVRTFLALVADVRRLSERNLVIVLVHHENKGGKVSGAWEGAGDTLVHVSAQGHGRTRVHFQKTRWASDYHATTLQLLWADGDGFQLEEKDELDDETLAEQIATFIGGNPGTGWGKVEEATPGVNRQRRRDVRDGLFASGRILNVKRKKGELESALDKVEEAAPSHLYLADDPTISHLRPESGAVGAQSEPAGGETDDERLRPAPHLKGAQKAQAQSELPVDEESEELG
jgi:AAA domain-containing protein